MLVSRVKSYDCDNERGNNKTIFVLRLNNQHMRMTKRNISKVIIFVSWFKNGKLLTLMSLGLFILGNKTNWLKKIIYSNLKVKNVDEMF